MAGKQKANKAKDDKGKRVARPDALAPLSHAQPPAEASGSNSTNVRSMVPLTFQSGSSSSATMPLAVASGQTTSSFSKISPSFQSKVSSESSGKLVDAPAPKQSAWMQGLTAPTAPTSTIGESSSSAPSSSRGNVYHSGGKALDLSRIAKNYTQQQDVSALKEIERNQKQTKKDKEFEEFGSAARGRDAPTMGDRNKPTKALLIERSTNSRQQVPKWMTWEDCKTKFQHFSQNPGLEIYDNVDKLDATDLGKFTIWPEQLEHNVVKLRDNRTLLINTCVGSIRRADLDTESVKRIFSGLHMKDLPDAQAKLVIDFYKQGDVNGGLEVFSFKLKCNEECPFLESSPITRTFKEHCSARFAEVWVAVIRNSFDCDTPLDRFWHRRMWACCKGIFPFYLRTLNASDNKYMPWMDYVTAKNGQPLVLCPALPWMEVVPDPTKPDEPKKIASLPPFFRFYSNTQYRNHMAAALARQTTISDEVIKANCNLNVKHKARVEICKPGHFVVMDVRFHRDQATDTVPKLTSLDLPTVREFQEEKMDQMIALVGEMGHGTGNALAAIGNKPDPPFAYKAQVVDERSTNKGDFKLLFNIQEDDPHLPKFQPNKDIWVSITLSQSHISTSRQMFALGKFTMPVYEKDEDAAKYDLQNLIFGNRLPRKTKEVDYIWFNNDIVEDERVMNAKAYKEKRWDSFNPSQQQVFNVVFEQSSIITQFQGPPGSGKTRTDSFIGTFANLHDFNVLACAPTQVATKQMMEKFEDERAVVEEMDTDGRMLKNSELIYVPSMYTTKLELQTRQLGFIHDQNSKRRDRRVGDDSYKHRMWYHFVVMTDADSRGLTEIIDADKKKAASEWLQQFIKVQESKQLTAQEIKDYEAYFDSNKRRVFHYSKKRLIVVMTNNNAHHFHKKLFDFQPDIAILDEAAFGLEADTIIPMSLWPKKVVISGDHKQLRPIVPYESLLDWSLPLGLSMFDRLRKNEEEDNRSILKLDVNYRMHPRIAEFPGFVSYGYLNCAINTFVETEQYKFCEDYFRFAQLDKRRRLTTHPVFRDAKLDCRRIVLSSNGSRSAPEDGMNSLRNFGNINVIVDVVNGMTEYAPKSEFKHDPEQVTIISGYREEVAVLEDQLKGRAKVVFDTSYLGVIDAIQGGENEQIILSITVANEFHGSLVGFLKEWPRMNVALTRAKSVLWIVGNFDQWDTEFEVLAADKQSKNWALFIQDVRDRGDIVDFYPPVKVDRHGHKTVDAKALRLPTETEFKETDASKWSNEIGHMRAKEFAPKLQDILNRSNPRTRAEKEEQLRKELDEKRTYARQKQEEWRKWEDSVEVEMADSTLEEGQIPEGPPEMVDPMNLIWEEAIKGTEILPADDTVEDSAVDKMDADVDADEDIPE